MKPASNTVPEYKIGDLSDPRVQEFLAEHIRDMQSVSPPESTHTLDVEGLRNPGIIFWSVWRRDELIGCAALKELDGSHAELKSMRVSPKLRGSGFSSDLLAYILEQARNKGYRKVSLETGSMVFFEPARKLYEKFGFSYCSPFSAYKDDPNSVFMSLNI